MPLFIFTPNIMASKAFHALLIISAVLTFPANSATAQECPYPCYPPPTGPGNNNPPATTTPPSQTGSNPPPTTTFPPPASTGGGGGGGGGGGNFYIPPPDFYNGGGGITPPPPEPITPWFPYFYKKPPRADQSSSPSIPRESTALTKVTALALFFIIFALPFY